MGGGGGGAVNIFTFFFFFFLKQLELLVINFFEHALGPRGEKN